MACNYYFNRTIRHDFTKQNLYSVKIIIMYDRSIPITYNFIITLKKNVKWEKSSRNFNSVRYYKQYLIEDITMGNWVYFILNLISKCSTNCCLSCLWTKRKYLVDCRWHVIIKFNTFEQRHSSFGGISLKTLCC